MTDGLKHALFSPSAAHRWMHCPGSVALCADLPQESSEYADEGTAAHTLASLCLPEKLEAKAFIDSAIKVGERTFVVDEEMADAVQTYMDNLNAFKAGGMLMVEQRFSIEHVTGEPDANGTSDGVVVMPDELQVHDLKYGKGVFVSAEHNPQIMLYGLGALRDLDTLGDFKRFRFVIHQPRINSAPSEWDCDRQTLMAFDKEVRARSKLALQAYKTRKDWIGTPQAKEHLNPSSEACQFCQAKANCPALEQLTADTVGLDFDDVNFPEPQEPGTVHPLDQQMSYVSLIELWCRAVRAKVESELLAGREVPNYKLVQGKRGTRQWEVDETAEAEMKAMRLKVDEMYNKKLKSPPQIEKVLKASPRKWQKLTGMIIQKEGALSVAHVSDPRKPVPVTPVVEDFADTASELADLL